MSEALDGIRQRATIAERSVVGALRFARTDVPRLLAALDAVLAETYASDDGTEWEHNDGCEGEPTCPACWAQDIRRTVNDALEADK